MHDAQAIIFGGSNGEHYYDDLFALNTKTWDWTKPRCTGARPSARSSHSMTAVGDKAVMFGGIGLAVVVADHHRSHSLNDVAVLDLKSWVWSAPLISGPPPKPRFVHRMVAMGDRLLLFGGRTSGAVKFNDLHWLDLKARKWVKQNDVVGEAPETRGGCTLAAVGTKALVFCGRTAGDRCLYDGLWILDTALDPPRWSKGDAAGLPEDHPSPRGAHGYAFLNNRLMVFGGFGPLPKHGTSAEQVLWSVAPLDQNERTLGDLYFLHLVSPTTSGRGVCGEVDGRLNALQLAQG